jgi:hypothetical protein
MNDIITRPNAKDEIKTERPRLHKVILVNDDYTPREFVVMILKAEFRMSEDQALRVMITAHRRGVCVVAVYGSPGGSGDGIGLVSITLPDGLLHKAGGRGSALRASLQRPAPTVALSPRDRATDGVEDLQVTTEQSVIRSLQPRWCRIDRWAGKHRRRCGKLGITRAWPRDYIVGLPPAPPPGGADCLPAAAMQGHAGHDAKGQHTAL